MSQGDDLSNPYRPGSAPIGPAGPELSWMDRQFKNTHIVVLILGSFCCQPIPLIFGIVGYVFKKLDYPIAPLVLALVIGDKAEDAFRQSMLMSQGSLGIFVANPLVATITFIAVGLVTWPFWAMLIGRARGVRGVPATAVED